MLDGCTKAEAFEYHTFLHHSQTIVVYLVACHGFEYHTFLHHSQTEPKEYYAPVQV